MAITIPSDSEVAALVFAYFRAAFPGRDLSNDSFLGKTAHVMAQTLSGLLRATANVDKDSPPSSNSSAQALDNWAFFLALSDGDGGIGRKVAIPATGGTSNFTGINGTAFPDGAVAVAPDGVTLIETSGAFLIPGIPPATGFVLGNLVAQTPGIAGNLPAGSILVWQSAPGGADATITLITPLTGGAEQESDSDLLARILERLQNPPRGGAAADYRYWAESAPGGGIYRAYVYPHRNGLGTVDVVATVAGSGAGRAPSAAQLTAVSEYINGTALTGGLRPVTAQGVRVMAPVTTQTVSVLISGIEPSGPAYAWDWIGSTFGYTVDTWTVGPPAKIRFNTIAHSTLTSAIDAAILTGSPQTTGPRLQFVTAGGPVLPFYPRCVAHAVVSGKTEVTLDSTTPLSAGWVAPAVGAAIYPVGPITVALAPALLSYIDSLGPSRLSGFADINDQWSDKAIIAEGMRLTMDVRDPGDGATRMVSNIDTAFGGVHYNAASVDYQAQDIETTGPNILVASSIVVTD